MSKTYQNILSKTTFKPAENWLQIKTIDMHTGGEPLRVIVDGFPELKGNSVLEYRRYCKENYDNLRTALMFEPRGHPDMYGCILLPPNPKENNQNKEEIGDFGIIFLHNEGYSTMCGHAIIAISTLAVEMNWIEVKEGENILKIDAPCGRITSFANVKNGKVTGVRFHCVPSFVVGLDKTVEVEGLGTVTYDLAYGGAFYAYVDMAKNNFNFDLSSNSYRDLIANGMKIKHAVMQNDSEIIHPLEDDLSFLYGTIFIDNNKQPSGNDSRNVCIFAEGEVDRCPTGSGVSGRMAIHKKRNEIDFNQTMSIESITDSVFIGSVVSQEKYGSFNAVIPQVSGTAYITGINTFVIDPNDPMKDGFILR
ncbi:proline racemase family protein [Tenacibaculum finnmarkense]|uniref:proline racemase family protein n=1 Tax=Tenacibaculum finnmarkense TaxID=2781243 RepID=UPI001EFA699E|nr:proline racemase family protein [Tenacibaculum finnmarkense]MCG8733848.1 proline racemase family protein [Tenacibaculum finnmarkense]WCC42763.1 proline racemase family protein [Tenacibaculum finnmarkense]